TARSCAPGSAGTWKRTSGSPGTKNANSMNSLPGGSSSAPSCSRPTHRNRRTPSPSPIVSPRRSTRKSSSRSNTTSYARRRQSNDARRAGNSRAAKADQAGRSETSRSAAPPSRRPSQISIDRNLLPLDRRRRLARDVVHDPVDTAHLVDDPVRHPPKQLVRQVRPVRGHEVLRLYRAQRDDEVVGAAVA